MAGTPDQLVYLIGNNEKKLKLIKLQFIPKTRKVTTKRN